MASTSEVGHAKNLANLQKLIDLCTQIGASYNPSNSQITVAGLTTLQTQCTTDYNDYVAKYTTWKNATNAREIAFKTVPHLSTQISDNVKTLNVPQQTINDVASLVHVIHGYAAKNSSSASGGTTPTTGTTPTPTGGGTTSTPTEAPPSDKTIGTPTPLPTPIVIPPADGVSTSHRSYDNILANFYKLLQLVQTISTYNPNEATLKVAALQSTYNNLNTLNNAATNSINALALSRNQRNISFYDDNTGMVATAKKVKSYIRQLEGSTSDIYHKATAIKFVKIISKKKKTK